MLKSEIKCKNLFQYRGQTCVDMTDVEDGDVMFPFKKWLPVTGILTDFVTNEIFKE